MLGSKSTTPLEKLRGDPSCSSSGSVDSASLQSSPSSIGLYSKYTFTSVIPNSPSP